MQERRPIEPLPLNDDELEFEKAMCQLSPTAPGFDARQIWMTAQARGQRRQLLFWRVVSGALAACLALAVWPRVAPIPIARPVTIARPAAIEQQPDLPPKAAPILRDSPLDWRADFADDSYLNVRQRVMQRGLSALDVGPHYATAAASDSSNQLPADLMPHIEPAVKPAAEGPINRLFNLLQKGTNL